MNILNILSYIKIKGMCVNPFTTLQFQNKSVQEGCNSSYNPLTLSEKSKMIYNLRTNVDFKGYFKWYELIILPGHVYVENKPIYVKKWFLTKSGVTTLLRRAHDEHSHKILYLSHLLQTIVSMSYWFDLSLIQLTWGRYWLILDQYRNPWCRLCINDKGLEQQSMVHLPKYTLFYHWPWGQGHIKCYPVPSTSCHLCTC